MVTRQAKHRIQKARGERFVKSLEEAGDTLDGVIERAADGDNRAFEVLESFNEQMERVYSRAEQLESD